MQTPAWRQSQERLDKADLIQGEKAGLMDQSELVGRLTPSGDALAPSPGPH